MRAAINTFTIIFLVSTFTASTIYPAITLTNGDFEAGNSGFSHDYNYATPNQSNELFVTNNANLLGWAPGLGDHTSGSGYMLMVNGSANIGYSFWKQSIDLTADTQYQFSGWAANLTENLVANQPPIIDLKVDGVSAGTFSGATADDVWVSFSFTWTPTQTSTVVLSLHDLNGSRDGNDFAIDDLSILAVPEPAIASLALGIFAVLFILLRHRLRT